MEFEQINEKIQRKLKMICDEDSYGLQPKSLYNNIRYSTGSYEQLASIFEIPVSVIKDIKEIQNGELENSR